MTSLTRRRFLQSTGALAAAGCLPGIDTRGAEPEGIPAGERAEQDESVRVLNPRVRVPLSFIIDDSTCLVNMGHFCMPQFAAAWPDRNEYKKPWSTWPREIPDAFVREFGEWCRAHGVKGKYSVVPNPACVGWLDRELPGWSRRQLLASLDLVRELMLPDWDIHPEMITHTRVIDLKTGRPKEEIHAGTMENSYPQEQRSADELAAYLAYALRILKNCGLPCEGITTPGGFGNRVKRELSLAVQQAVRDVFQPEIPHYFKYVIGRGGSTEPRLEHVAGLGTGDLRLSVNVVAGTGDWFGGWDGDRGSEPDRYITRDGQQGRLVEMIRRREPAVFLCHWPGLYCHGTRTGLRAFQQVVTSLHEHYRDETVWMKLSAIARYWAAKGLTTITRAGDTITLEAPVSCPDLTLRIESSPAGAPLVQAGAEQQSLREVQDRRQLAPGTWLDGGDSLIVCLALRAGVSTLSLPTR